LRLAPIEALRGLAALLVVAGHILIQLGEEFGTIVLPLGYGCDLFFVISGFIMAYIEPRNPAEFLKRRAFRIVPLYWIATAAAIAGLLLSGENVGLGEAIASFAFVPLSENWLPVLPVGWTLNYEVLFYVLFAACLVLPAYRLTVLVGVLGLMVAAGLAFELPGPLEFLLNPVLLEFAAGVGIAALFKRVGSLASWPLFAAFAGSGALLFVFLPDGARLLKAGLPAVLMVGATVLFLPSRYTLPGWVVGTGTVSYSLYLTHPFTLKLTAPLMSAGPLLYFPLSIGACLVVACAVYFLVERSIRPSPTAAPLPGR
jgi:exopolysaccharide production protein ExoZ